MPGVNILPFCAHLGALKVSDFWCAREKFLSLAKEKKKWAKMYKKRSSDARCGQSFIFFGRIFTPEVMNLF